MIIALDRGTDMNDLLTNYYQINAVARKVVDEKQGFIDDKYVYFIMSADNKEAIHMEQATLAYFLVENGFNQVALPIPNINGDWITEHEENRYMVVRHSFSKRETATSHGQLLANFHRVNQTYQYDPPNISSYGRWKTLWIDKLTLFEQYITEQAQKSSSSFYRLVMDILPYLIGMSENAIQYLQESERESRFNEVDQGTITFQRYDLQLLKPIIWFDDLVYDHPARDISEYIRKKLLNIHAQGVKESVDFMYEYRSINPLSVLSWRLMYARLIFPIHLFDVIEKAFMTEEYDKYHEKLEKLVEYQPNYEKDLTQFFQNTVFNDEDFRLPMIEWI